MSVETISCPSCGAAQDLENPIIVQVTCPYCDSISLRNLDELKETGKKARLMPAISGLTIGSEGKLFGREFRIIGRIRYTWSDSGILSGREGSGKTDPGSPDGEGSQSPVRKTGNHPRGGWDEWYARLDDDETIWLSEDMGELIAERPAEIRKKLDPGKINPGDRIKHEKKTFVVREVNRAICAGTQGQLPFAIAPREEYPYIDAASLNGKEFLGLEFDRRRGAEAFLGRRLKPEEIVYERSEIDDDIEEGEVIACPGCGSPVDPLGDSKSVLTIICQSCSSTIDISEGTALATGRVEAKLADVFKLKLGVRGNLKGVEWMVAGRMRYEWEQEGETGINLEYLLYNEIKGYRWLAESEDVQFALGRPVDYGPEEDLFKGKRGRAYKIKDVSYRFFEKGALTLKYVDGALPWRARVGDRSMYAEALAPPLLFTAELSRYPNGGGELEFFHSKYIPLKKIAEAFKLSGLKAKGRSPLKP